MEKVAIIGSGNWGSVVSKIIGNNIIKEENSDFDKDVKILKIPENVKAVSNLLEACSDATVLVFVIPHQFVKGICLQLVGNTRVKRVISLVKGLDVTTTGMKLVSEIITNILLVEVCVLMGANIANEVAKELFCESTLGYNEGDEKWAEKIRKIFHTEYFKVTKVSDVSGVEISGALKNIIALGAGFIDGLGLGSNTKSAIIRIGLQEMRRFAKIFYKGVKESTFFESCGIADLITTCYGGRNRRVAEAMVITGKSLEILEEEMLNGQKLQGTLAAKEVYRVIEQKGIKDQFPLMVSIYLISFENLPAIEIIKSALKSK